MEENKKMILTEENIDELVEVLSENVNDDIQMLRNLPSNQGVETNTDDIIAELVPMEAVMTVNPNNGEFVPKNLNDEISQDADVNISDIAADESFNLKDVDITEQMIAENKEFGDLSDDDSKALFDIIMRYRKGEKFSIYNAFPDSIKSIANKIAYQMNGNKNSVAKMILEQFITDMQLDKAFIEFNDAIMKELKLPGLTEIYSDHRQEIMEVKLLESADKIESEYPEKAKLLREISAMYTETYKMNILKNALSNRKNRQFLKDIKNYEKVCRDFNIKYEKSRFKINNVLMLAPILNRKLPNIYTQEDIMKFVMLFCRECYLKDPNEVLDHVFMYYTIQNILMLDYVVDSDESTPFLKQLLSNICEVIDKIKELQ